MKFFNDKIKLGNPPFLEFPLFDVDDVDGVDGEVEPFCPGLYPRRPAAARVKNRRALAAQAGKICENS